MSKYSAKYRTHLLSTGVSSLDNLLAGGLPTTSITLIEEDYRQTHSSLLCKHFVLCGLLNSHETAVIMDNTLPETYLENLPKVSSTNSSKQQDLDKLSDLNIAWRYKQMRSVDDDFVNSKGNETTAGKADHSKFHSHFIAKPKLSENLSDVLDFVEKLLKDKAGLRKPLRLVINSLGSPLWGECGDLLDLRIQLNTFLHHLRLIISESMMSVIFTTNKIYFGGKDPIRLLSSCVDFAFRFIPFDDPKKVSKELSEDITGIMRIVRIPCINSIERIIKPKTIEWSYHIRKEKMIFKEFTLPPCLGDTTSRTNQNDASKTMFSSTGCGVEF